MWTDGYFRLFISHVSSHKEMAHGIKAALEPYYISCFVAHDDIEPTREWQDEIEEALRTMDALAAVLTTDFHASLWTDHEVGFALGTGKLVVPLRFGQDPYGFLGKYQGYTLKPEIAYATIATDLIGILSRHGMTSLKMSAALVKRFEDSWSWDTAKNNMTLLEQCVVMDDALLTRVEVATATNGQISSAWGVPERVKTLIGKHKGKIPA